MPDSVSIVGVLVLYRLPLEKAPVWRQLEQQVDAAFLARVPFHLLVCDNGPLPPRPPLLPAWAAYVGVAENRGLAWAYERGLDQARARGAAWLLTLDQDMQLTPHFLERMAAAAAASASDPQLGAIVPQLLGGDRVYSPAVVTWRGTQMLARGENGFLTREARAFNAGALLRTSALASVGGYDRRFWLDFLDHAAFSRLHRGGYKVAVRGDVQLQHSLSLQDERAGISAARFLSFSEAESAYHDLYGSLLARNLFTARLVLRVLRQWLRKDPLHFGKATRKVLRERLFLARSERLRRWEQRQAPMMEAAEVFFPAQDASGKAC